MYGYIRCTPDDVPSSSGPWQQHQQHQYTGSGGGGGGACQCCCHPSATAGHGR